MHEGCNRCGDDTIADADVVRAEGTIICAVAIDGIKDPFDKKAAYEYDGKNYSLDGDHVILVSRCNRSWVSVYWIIAPLVLGFVNAHFNEFALGRIKYVGNQYCVRKMLAALDN